MQPFGQAAEKSDGCGLRRCRPNCMGDWANRTGNQSEFSPNASSSSSYMWVQLLNHEPRASKQVPLLLTMKEDNLALIKAIDSGDPDFR